MCVLNPDGFLSNHTPKIFTPLCSKITCAIHSARKKQLVLVRDSSLQKKMSQPESCTHATLKCFKQHNLYTKHSKNDYDRYDDTGVFRRLVDIQGWSYLLGQKLSTCFVLRFALQRGEEGEKREECKFQNKARITFSPRFNSTPVLSTLSAMLDSWTNTLRTFSCKKTTALVTLTI